MYGEGVCIPLRSGNKVRERQLVLFAVLMITDNCEHGDHVNPLCGGGAENYVRKLG